MGCPKDLEAYPRKQVSRRAFQPLAGLMNPPAGRRFPPCFQRDETLPHIQVSQASFRLDDFDAVSPADQGKAQVVSFVVFNLRLPRRWDAPAVLR